MKVLTLLSSQEEAAAGTGRGLSMRRSRCWAGACCFMQLGEDTIKVFSCMCLCLLTLCFIYRILWGAEYVGAEGFLVGSCSPWTALRSRGERAADHCHFYCHKHFNPQPHVTHMGHSAEAASIFV